VFEVYTHIEINAPSKIVWDVLTDLDSYHLWNPFIKNIEGTLAIGEKVNVTIIPFGSNKPTTFKSLIVHSLLPEKELSWTGKVFFPFLFYGHHLFQIKPVNENSSLFINKESLHGLIPLLYKKTILYNTTSRFNEMNIAMKHFIEKS